jgi:hypothetical protein
MTPCSLAEITFRICVLRSSLRRSFHTTKQFHVLIKLLPWRWKQHVTPKRVTSYQTTAHGITTQPTLFQHSSHYTRLRDEVLTAFTVRFQVFWVVTPSSTFKSSEVHPGGTIFRNVGNKMELQFTVISQNTWIIHARFLKIHFSVTLQSKPGEPSDLYPTNFAVIKFPTSSNMPPVTSRTLVR